MKEANENIKIEPRAARINVSLSREEASKRIGIGKYALINIEKGITYPTVPVAYKMAEVYNIPLDNLSFCKKLSL